MAVDVVEILKWLGTFTWEGVLNGAVRCTPAGYNALPSSFNRGERN